MIPVGAATELALRTAMARLIEGRTEITDGHLTVVNLAAEAGVSRATANRATAVLTAFREAIANANLGKQRSGGTQPVRHDKSLRRVEDLLAQHEQVRALLRISELRRTEREGIRLRIVGRR